MRKANYKYVFPDSYYRIVRQRSDLSWDITAGYEYNDHLTFQLGFEQESINSNVPQDEYRYRIYTAGIDWEF